MAVGAFEVGLSLRGKQVLGMDAYQIGMMFTECSLVMFVVQALVFSPLVKPELTRWFFTPGLASWPSAFASSARQRLLSTVVAVALVAASAGILSPIVTYWVSLGAGKTQGAALGRVTAAASLGQAVGSAAGGVLFNVALLPNAGFTVAALIVAAGLVGSIGLPRLLWQRLQPEGSEPLPVVRPPSGRSSRRRSNPPSSQTSARARVRWSMAPVKFARAIWGTQEQCRKARRR